MRRFDSACVAVLVVLGLLQGAAARKPSMIPAEKDYLIQEGDELKIVCQGKSALQFSTQKNWANVDQTMYNTSFKNDSGFYTYTFTRPNATKEDTGWYACAEEGIEIQNDERTIDHPDTHISWIYVYVNSSIPFAIDTYNDATNSTSILTARRSKNLVIPCRPTSPDLPVVLDVDDGELPKPDNIMYNSRIGFIIKILTPSLRRTIFRCKINETGHTYADHWPTYTIEFVRIIGGPVVRVKLGDSATLLCYVESKRTVLLGRISWFKMSGSKNTKPLKNRAINLSGKGKRPKMKLKFSNVSRKDNGTYRCILKYNNRTFHGQTYLTVTEVPTVRIDIVKAIGADSVYLSWMITHDGNEPVETLSFEQRKKNEKEWNDVMKNISIENRSFIIKGLESNTTYEFRIIATNSIGDSKPAKTRPITTFEKDIEYHPNVTAGEVTSHSIEITWSVPPPELRDLIMHYDVHAINDCNASEWFSKHDKRNNSHVFQNLEPDTTYNIIVHAFYKYQKQLISWRPIVRYRTLAVEKESSKYTGLVISLIISILLLIMMVIWSRIQRRRELAARRRFIEAAIEVFRLGARGSVDPELDMAAQAELLPYNEKWEFPKRLLKFDKVLGSGAFGIVKKAEAKSICKRQKYSTVAVKMVRATHRLDHMMALQRELKILVHLGKHINVVNLLGACTNRISYGELLVIVEFCRFGNLHDYLRRRRADFVDQIVVDTGTIAGPSFRTDNSANAIDWGMITADLRGDLTSTDLNDTSDDVEDPDSREDAVDLDQVINYEGDFTDSDLGPIGTRDLLCWAWQVSRGMNYLSSKKVLHGDLAARNILLADHNVVKICDFGLAKSLYASDIYKKEGNGPLPVKWMAIESIGDRIFSVKSDVWSFGVVLWEFFALAETPYPGIANESVYTKLVDGYRMERPKYATEDVYRMMLSCWNAEPSKRPSFRELEDIIDGYLDARSKEHYLDFDAAYAKINAETSASEGVDYLTMSPSEYASGGTLETTV